ncbi:MAG: glycosyltransferase family 2 protein [Candidatus Aenigmarchaeota archaeon]|nr:glycosyltransferase family 2 protein [Candidatus Aenigmarchaeota archaeon]MDW8149207.1 glycosyltransferase family 2 protein [Candidatus Aenigmarchaeota archaeon]
MTLKNLEKELYTVENYNKTIKNIIRNWKKDLLCFCSTIGSIASLSLLFPIQVTDYTLLHQASYYLKFSWYVSLPYLSLYFINRFIGIKKRGKDLLIKKEDILQNDYSKNKIIFHIVTRGTNYEVATKNTFKTKEMNEYVKQLYNLNYDYEVWLVTEEDCKEKFENIKDEKIRVIIVPKDFETENGAKYKGRALEYSRRLMLKENILNENNFIYYQDEESFIGEDTVFGILDFIRKNDGYVGRGIITYPRNFRKSSLDYWEFYRSSQDLDRLIITNKICFHGSHFIINSNILRKVSFDYKETLVEDLKFKDKIAKVYGEKNIKLIKGFCYESPPLSAIDLLKQRGRWFIGVMKSMKDVEKIHEKVVRTYYLISWLSSLPSLIAVVLSAIAPTDTPFFPISGILSGFIIYNLIDIYRSGYKLNETYVNSSKLSLLKGLKGLFLESIAPWIAIYRNIKKEIKGFEVIRKV